MRSGRGASDNLQPSKERTVQNATFVLVLGAFSFLLIGWGFRSLPEEKWQIAFAAPAAKLDSGVWRSTNYTYYGAFQALALIVSGSLFYVLVGALDVSLPPAVAGSLVAAFVVVCFGSSRVLARVVEKKPHTSTIGGAFFAGLIAAPWLIAAANRVAVAGPGPGIPLPVMPVLGAATTAYAMGEGLGRLSCISFGCCYGKPVSQLSPALRGFFSRHSFIFSGGTKKIAYEAGLDGTRVVPIQAITSVFLVLTSLAATYLFLDGFYSGAFLLSTIASQLWRCFSETLRADYRGEGRVTAYQAMAAFAVPYALLIWAVFPVDVQGRPDIAAGIAHLWSPAPILALQALATAIFIASGRSKVTESFLTPYVRRDRV
jgi:hypothetical protein